MYSGSNDTCYIQNSTFPTVHPPNPEIWFNHDIYWILDHDNGFKFGKTRTSKQYYNN